MLKLKLQYFGHLMGRIDSLERPWCWERLKAGGEGDITDLMDMSLSKPQELLMQQQPEAWFTAVHELQRVGHDWAIEQNWWQQYQSMGSKTPLLQFIQGGEIGDSWGKEGVVSYRKLPDLSNRKSLELPCSVSSQEVSLQGSATRNYNDKCRSWYVLYTYVPVTGLRSQYLSRRLLLKAHISTFTFNCKKRERERDSMCFAQDKPWTVHAFSWLLLNSEIRASCCAWWLLFFFPFFFFFFLPQDVALRILAPQPGIEPMPPAVEVQSLNHWTTREVLWWFLLKISFIKQRWEIIHYNGFQQSQELFTPDVSFCHFPCLQNGENDNAYWIWFLWGLNQVIHWKIETSIWYMVIFLYKL